MANFKLYRFLLVGPNGLHWRGQHTCFNYVYRKVPQCLHNMSTKASDESEEHRQRKLHVAESVHSTKYNLGMLKQKMSINTRKAYHPPSDVTERIERIAKLTLSDKLAIDWRSTSLSDPKRKFKFLTKVITEFGHNVPNSVLCEIKSVGDAVDFFSTEVRATSTYQDMCARNDLPQNLSIQSEYLRFDPETDTMFGGRTAFPGRDTNVTSIKYRRKYSGVKNTKDKAGYVNYYYGY